LQDVSFKVNGFFIGAPQVTMAQLTAATMVGLLRTREKKNVLVPHIHPYMHKEKETRQAL
jgi:hypothetical protein